MIEEFVLALISPIIQAIFDEIKKCKDRNTPEKKQLKADIENMIYEWSENLERENEESINKLLSGHEHEKEIKETVQKLSDEKVIPDNFFDELFHGTINRIKAFKQLIKKQIEGYAENLDLSKQLHKEKNALMSQLKEDMNTYWGIIMAPTMKASEQFQIIDINDFLKGHNEAAKFKEDTINKTEVLLENIINRISIN